MYTAQPPGAITQVLPGGGEKIVWRLGGDDIASQCRVGRVVGQFDAEAASRRQR